jgi:hypothetical protein
MRKLIVTTILVLALSLTNFADVCNDSYVDLRNLVTKMGWTITSEMGGGHNAHSRHYVGKAIDIRSRGRDEFHVTMLFMVLENQGYIVKDERTRPKGQRVWKGAHFHLGIPYCK